MTIAATAPDQASLFEEQAYAWLWAMRIALMVKRREQRQPLGLRAACCRFGVTQPAATPTTPAPRAAAILLPHLPRTSRLTAGCLGESGSRLHAVQGLMDNWSIHTLSPSAVSA